MARIQAKLDRGDWLTSAGLLALTVSFAAPTPAVAQAQSSPPVPAQAQPVPPATPQPEPAGGQAATPQQEPSTDVSSTKTGQLEEIVVTARRVEENVQRTPIAVTAFTAKSLEARGLSNISQLSNFVPNLQFTPTANISGSTSAASVFIRGIGQTDFAPTTEPGVGIYLDGVYIARSVGSVLDIADVERVEVLRGPQGTLFGKNTIGGAINVTTFRPTNQYAGRFEATTGSFNRADVKAMVNVPLSSTLFARLSVATLNREGYAKRIIAGDRLGGKHTIAGRLSLLYDPKTNFEYRVDIDGTHQRGESAPSTLLGVQTPFCTNCAPVVGFLNLTLPPDQQYTYANYATGDPYTTRGTGPNRDDADIWGVAGTGVLHLSDQIALKSITAYRDLKAHFGRDADNSPLLVVHTLDKYGQRQFSQEFQLTGKSFDNRLDWLLGAFYFKEKGVDVNDVPLSGTFGAALGIPTPGGATTIRSGGKINNDTYAAFGHFTYKFTEQFHLSGGLRYSYEKKRFLPDQYVVEARAAGITTCCGGLILDPLILPVEVSTSLRKLTPQATLEYQATPDVLLYTSYSTGYKGGGFVQRIFPGRPTTAPSFGPETATVYEAGLKSEFADHHVRFNADAFYTNYRDIQVTILLPSEFGPRTINAGKGHIQGIEAELNARPFAGLTLTGGLGLTDAKYDVLPAGATSAGLTLSSKFPQTSKWTLNGSAEYAIPVGRGLDLAFRGDWSYRTSYYLAAVNTPHVYQPGYSLVNVSTALRADRGWSVQAGIHNLFDKHYLTGANDELGGLGYAEGTYAPPREWYASLRYEFK